MRCICGNSFQVVTWFNSNFTHELADGRHIKQQDTTYQLQEQLRIFVLRSVLHQSTYLLYRRSTIFTLFDCSYARKSSFAQLPTYIIPQPNIIPNMNHCSDFVWISFIGYCWSLLTRWWRYYGKYATNEVAYKKWKSADPYLGWDGDREDTSSWLQKPEKIWRNRVRMEG